MRFVSTLTMSTNMADFTVNINSTSPSPAPLYPAICNKPSDDSKNMLEALAAIYMFSSLLSIMGSLSIVVYTCVKKVVCNPEILPLFHLSLADLLLACGWFSTTTLWWFYRHEDAEDIKSCFYLEIATEIFHVVSFFLTVNYATHVFIRIKQRTTIESGGHSGSSYRKVFICLYAASWILPVLLMLPMVIFYSQKDFFDCTKCLLLFDRPKARIYEHGIEITNHDSFGWRNYGSLLLVLTLGVSIVLMLVLYFVSVREYTKFIKRSGLLSIQQRQLIESNKRRVMLFIGVFFVCWLPAFIVAFVDLGTEDKDYNFKKMFFVFLIEGFLTPMQGFLNSLVYGWTRRSFRSAGQNRMSYRRPLVPPDFIGSMYGTSGRET